MTWAGESSTSGIMTFTDGDSHGVIEPGTEGQILTIVNGSPIFVDASVAQSGQHNLLSETHLDTIPSSPVNGDFIFASGNSWTRFEVGQTNQIIKVNASGFPEWTNDVLNVPNASGFNLLDSWHKYADGPDATSSTSYIAIDKMTAIPGSGTYAITFSATVESSKSSTAAAVSIFIDNVAASGTERISDFSSAGTRTVIVTNGIVELLEGEELSIRWKRIGGPGSTTLTMESRDMMGVRVRSLVDV
jgi:hypothetical protein